MTFQEAINDILISINQEENSLANLLKQEAAKIEKFTNSGASAEDLLKINNSVNATVSAITDFEEILKSKLNLIKPYINN
jgi:AICAR transformylase/IMP cyclohydrolase PurH